MKNLRPALPILMCALALPFASAAPPKDARVLVQGVSPEKRIERDVLIRHVPKAREMETVAFLGVETVPVAPVLSAQLGLAQQTGLVVRHVVPESPAANVLKEHDVLLKLDDQILIEPRQFSVLVRNRQEGEEVSLTFYRGGKQATAKVKLGKHEVPKMTAAMHIFSDAAGEPRDVLGFAPVAEGRQEMRQVLALLHDEPDAGVAPRRLPLPPGAPELRALTVNPSNSNMVYTDEQGSLEITIKDGKKSLVAKNAKGEQIYSGPIDTPEERKALPVEVRERLDQIEGMRSFSFELDDDFHSRVRAVPAIPRKISRPLPPVRVKAWPVETPSPAI